MQTLHSNKTTSFIDTGQSVMTKILADSLAGNALTLVIGTLKQGELSESEALLKHLQVCHRANLHAISFSEWHDHIVCAAAPMVHIDQSVLLKLS